MVHLTYQKPTEVDISSLSPETRTRLEKDIKLGIVLMENTSQYKSVLEDVVDPRSRPSRAGLSMRDRLFMQNIVITEEDDDDKPDSLENTAGGSE